MTDVINADGEIIGEVDENGKILQPSMVANVKDIPPYILNLKEWEKARKINKIKYEVGDECVFEITKGDKKWTIPLDDFFDKVIQICGEKKMTNYDILKEYEAHQTPVPSYDEWINFKKLYASMEEDRMELKEDLLQATIDFNKMVCKNAQLKELLEWCRDELFEVYSNEVSHPEDVPIIKKLNEVLK